MKKILFKGVFIGFVCGSVILFFGNLLPTPSLPPANFFELISLVVYYFCITPFLITWNLVGVFNHWYGICLSMFELFYFMVLGALFAVLLKRGKWVTSFFIILLFIHGTCFYLFFQNKAF